MGVKRRTIVKTIISATLRYIKDSFILSGIVSIIFLCLLPPDDPVAVTSLRGSSFLCGFGLTLAKRIFQAAHLPWPKKP